MGGRNRQVKLQETADILKILRWCVIIALLVYEKTVRQIGSNETKKGSSRGKDLYQMIKLLRKLRVLINRSIKKYEYVTETLN